LPQIRIANFHLEHRLENKKHRREQLEAVARALLLPCTSSLLFTTGSELGRLSPPQSHKMHLRPLAVLLGDTGVSDSSELEFLLQGPCGFIDAYAMVPKSAKSGGEVDEFGDATLGVTYPRKGGSKKKVDYVLFGPSDQSGGNGSVGDVRAFHHHRATMKPVEARLLGRSPIPGQLCDAGRDGKLYPSGHLGVFIRFEGL
jgi:hypothetical protein